MIKTLAEYKRAVRVVIPTAVAIKPSKENNFFMIKAKAKYDVALATSNLSENAAWRLAALRLGVAD